MKSLPVSKSLVFLLAALALAQFACGVGGAAPSNNPQASSGSSQPTEAAPATSAPASERGTPAEAQAMLKLAVEHYQTVGRDQALADFNGRKPPFFDRDLYVVCMDSSHIETANGGFPQYVGSSADALMDADGKPLGKTAWDTASTTAVNSVNYQWLNPVSGQMEPKTLFFQKVGTDVCGVGAYNP